MFRTVSFALLAVAALAAAPAADAAPKPPRKPAQTTILDYTPPELPADDEAGLIEAHGFAPADVGYVLAGPDGAARRAHNADRPFIPASVAKLPTAVAALEILGGDYRFRTRLASAAEVRGATLRGDLYLVGGGDPLLGPDDLLGLCQRLRGAGVTRISGSFHYDAGRYASRRQIRADQPEDVQYNPGVSALSVDFNRVRVEWRRRGDRTYEAWSLPDLPGIRLGGANPMQVPVGQTWTHVDGGWKLDPDARRAGAAKLPVREPGRIAAQLTRKLCRRMGVRLPEPTPAAAPADASPLAVHASVPLTRVVQQMLRYSNNLVAELVGLAAGRRLTGEALDIGESSRLLGDWLASTVPGADWSSYAPHNHSGLASAARATPAQLVALLSYAQDKRYGAGRRSLLSLLPAAGGSGTLAGRLRTPDTAFDVWAKTGTMHFASGLAGYLLGGDGETRSFAVFVNDQALRRAYDGDPRRRDGSWSGRIYPWRHRAKALEADLVRLWARR